MEINFVKYKWLYFIFSGLAILACVFSLITYKLTPGIDFTGGSILEIQYTAERPSNAEIKDALANLDLGEIYVQPTDDNGVIIRMKDINEDTHQKVIEQLKATTTVDSTAEEDASVSDNNTTIEVESGDVSVSLDNLEQSQKNLEELRFESIGPVIGQELKQKTKVVTILALLIIVFYVAIAFRKIARPIASWQYGIVTLIALFHDVLIPLGALSVLGHFYGTQITIPVIVALLTVIGYSVNDTVIIFDRIRENLIRREGTYENIVNISINQSLGRSINTSLTTLFTLVAIFFLGGETLKYFSLALIVGIIAGTYSSLFLAGPILISWLGWRRK